MRLDARSPGCSRQMGRWVGQPLWRPPISAICHAWPPLAARNSPDPISRSGDRSNLRQLCPRDPIKLPPLDWAPALARSAPSKPLDFSQSRSWAASSLAPAKSGGDGGACWLLAAGCVLAPAARQRRAARRPHHQIVRVIFAPPARPELAAREPGALGAKITRRQCDKSAQGAFGRPHSAFLWPNMEAGGRNGSFQSCRRLRDVAPVPPSGCRCRDSSASSAGWSG